MASLSRLAACSRPAACRFDLHNNAGEGTDSTGVYFNGESPTIGTNTVNLAGTGINLQSGHIFLVKIQPRSRNYVERMTITDLTTCKVYSHEWLVGAPPLSGGDDRLCGTYGGYGCHSKFDQDSELYLDAAVTA